MITVCGKIDSFYAYSSTSDSIFIKLLVFEVHFTWENLFRIFAIILFAGQTLAKLSKISQTFQTFSTRKFLPITH